MAGSGSQGSATEERAARTPLRVLLDTNVLLDLFLNRVPWLTEAQPMWEARDDGRLRAYIPASVLTDVFYITRKQTGTDGARRILQTCLTGFSILRVDRGVMEAALSMPGDDFEDNVQIVCAMSAGLDLVVTRNKDDFRESPISAIEPPEIVSYLTS